MYNCNKTNTKTKELLILWDAALGIAEVARAMSASHNGLLLEDHVAKLWLAPPTNIKPVYYTYPRKEIGKFFSFSIKCLLLALTIFRGLEE